MCEERGRDPADVPTIFRCPIRLGGKRDGLMTGATGEIAEDIAAYAAAGVQELIWDVVCPTATEIGEMIDRVAKEVVPAAAG